MLRDAKESTNPNTIPITSAVFNNLEETTANESLHFLKPFKKRSLPMMTRRLNQKQLEKSTNDNVQSLPTKSLKSNSKQVSVSSIQTTQSTLINTVNPTREVSLTNLEDSIPNQSTIAKPSKSIVDPVSEPKPLVKPNKPRAINKILKHRLPRHTEQHQATTEPSPSTVKEPIGNCFDTISSTVEIKEQASNPLTIEVPSPSVGKHALSYSYAVNSVGSTPMETNVLKKIREWTVWEVGMLRELARMIEPVYAADKLHDISASRFEQQEENEHNILDEKKSDSEKELKRISFRLTDYDVNERISMLSRLSNNPTYQASKSLKHTVFADGAAQPGFGKSIDFGFPASSQSPVQQAIKPVTIKHKMTVKKPTSRVTTPAAVTPWNFESTSLRPRSSTTKTKQSKNNPYDPGRLSHAEQDNRTPSACESDDEGKSNHESALDDHVSDTHDAHPIEWVKEKRLPFQRTVEMKLGRLGPDKSSDEYLLKLEKWNRQKEYSERVRSVGLTTKPERKVIDHEEHTSSVDELNVSELLEPHTRAKCDTPKTRLPLLARNPVADYISEAASKREKMRSYAEIVRESAKRRASKVSSADSLNEKSRFPPIHGEDRRMHSSAPISASVPSPEIKSLADAHKRDMAVVDRIKNELRMI